MLITSYALAFRGLCKLRARDAWHHGYGCSPADEGAAGREGGEGREEEACENEAGARPVEKRSVCSRHFGSWFFWGIWLGGWG